MKLGHVPLVGVFGVGLAGPAGDDIEALGARVGPGSQIAPDVAVGLLCRVGLGADAAGVFVVRGWTIWVSPAFRTVTGLDGVYDRGAVVGAEAAASADLVLVASAVGADRAAFRGLAGEWSRVRRISRRAVRCAYGAWGVPIGGANRLTARAAPCGARGALSLRDYDRGLLIA